MAIPADRMVIIRDCIRKILVALGEDPQRPDIRDTPKRVADLWSDILDGRFAEEPKLTDFKPPKRGDLVLVHHVPFYAFCEHHLCVFLGQFAVGYIPDARLVGLSKLVRVFRHFTKRITIQERLTEEVADKLVDLLKPKGVMIYVEAEHTCMTLRGVKSPGCRTITVASRGKLDTDQRLRSQFLELVR